MSAAEKIEAITHVEVRHWERIARTDKHNGVGIWSARVFHGATLTTYHRADTYMGVAEHFPSSWEMRDAGITFSKVRVARKADL